MQQEGRDGGPLRRLHVRADRLGRARRGALADHVAAPPVSAAAAGRDGRHEEGDAGADEQGQEAVAILGGRVAVRARRCAAGRAPLSRSLGTRRRFSSSGKREGVSEAWYGYLAGKYEGMEVGRAEAWLTIVCRARQNVSVKFSVSCGRQRYVFSGSVKTKGEGSEREGAGARGF